MRLARFFPVLILLHSQFAFALTHSRSYSWGFATPNLVSNWSFENPLDFWKENAMAPNTTILSRYKAAGTPVGSAKTGSFVAVVSGTSLASNDCIYTDPFKISPNTNYTLSFYYKTNGSLTGAIYPSVTWYGDAQMGGATGSSAGANLSAASGWTLYTMTFTTPANASYLRITLAHYSANASGTTYYDDVVLEEGNLTSAQVAANRQNISETMAFGDALGRSLQSQTKVSQTGDKYLVGGTGFNAFAQPETTLLSVPYSQSAPTFQSNLLQDSKNYYGANGPFDAKGYPFSRTLLTSDPHVPIEEMTSPDSAWQIGKFHTTKRGCYYATDSLIPPNVENPSTNIKLGKYRVDWIRDPDNAYTLTWTNKLGQLIRTAKTISSSQSPANTWKWSTNRYEYFPNGTLGKTHTPIDDSAGTDVFAEFDEYDAQGNPISSYSPDGNLRKFWYNRAGMLRYSQDSVQRALGQYSYFDYDEKGRLISEGIQTVGALPQDSVDNDTYSQGTKSERIGYIYDDTAGFQARTGFLLQDILGYFRANVDVSSLHNRIFCKYNRNADNSASGLADKDKLVADFFTYDDQGRVAATWKYIGPIRDPSKKLQDVWFGYDAAGRLTSYLNAYSGYELGVSNSGGYTYDQLGRVVSVTDLDGKPLAKYTYADWGPLNDVALGGLPNGDSATYMDMFYTSHGGISSIAATGQYGPSSKRIFQQFLGYENKALAASGVPNLLQPKFDGTISQQVYKFTQDMNAVNPVRAVNYKYDLLDRMGQAKGYWNTNSNPLDASEGINTSALTMDTTGSLSSTYEFDLNSRILGQRSNGVASVDSARYYYQAGSYKLDRVTGKLSGSSTRNLSTSGSLIYDANGAIVQDKSKRMKIIYGWDGLPVSFSVDSAYSKGAIRCCYFDADGYPRDFRIPWPTLVYYNFYDADGNRVSRLESETKGSYRTRSTNYIYTGPGMLKEWREEYTRFGKIKSTSAVVSLFGRGPQIGRIRPDGKYEFFVKNHLGSTMRTVDDRGRYVNTDERVYDYLAYGQKKDLKVGSSNSDVTQKWTGKELEAATNLYAFGARWMDSELGMFMSPDPAGQYANPYSYGAGDPVNGTDPSGMVWDVFRPSKWENFFSDAGKSTNDFLESSYNKMFNDNCHYESFESCRDRWTDKVGTSNGVFQLEQQCMGGNSDACSTLNEIGDNFMSGGGAPTDANRRLAKLIAESGHSIGFTISAGGGAAVAEVNYDDVTIPLGLPKGNQSSIDDSKGITFTPRDPSQSLSGVALAEYEVIQGQAQAFWEEYANSDMQAAISKFGTSREIGFLYTSAGALKMGPALGTFHENGVATMGDVFDRAVRPGNIMVHSHPFSQSKADWGYGGLSGFGGDMSWSMKHNAAVYAYETSNHRLFYSNPTLIKVFGYNGLSLSNMYLGEY